jgi:hypothetical protein
MLGQLENFRTMFLGEGGTLDLLLEMITKKPRAKTLATPIFWFIGSFNFITMEIGRAITVNELVPCRKLC